MTCNFAEPRAEREPWRPCGATTVWNFPAATSVDPGLPSEHRVAGHRAGAAGRECNSAHRRMINGADRRQRRCSGPGETHLHPPDPCLPDPSPCPPVPPVADADTHVDAHRDPTADADDDTDAAPTPRPDPVPSAHADADAVALAHAHAVPHASPPPPTPLAVRRADSDPGAPRRSEPLDP